jgi:flagellar biosynthesis regulator FlaF
MAVIFPILSTFDASGVTKAQRAFKGLNGVARTSAIAFGALGAAAGKFGLDAVKAAAQDQKAQLKLAKTLQNVTKATDAQIAANEKFIASMQFATGVNDSELRPALENLLRATGDITQAQNLLKLGLDVSAGSGKSLEVVSLSLTKALGGNFAGLSKLGIVIPENIKKSKDFAQVQAHLNTLFGGQAAVAAQTFSGKLAIMRERLTEAQETIGSLLLPILTKLVNAFLNNVMPAIERVVEVIQFQGAGAGLEAIGTEIANVITNLDGTAAKVKNVILIFLGIKTVTPLVYALRTAWVATATAIGATATATTIAAGVMKSALISTGIGALVVAAGFLVAKIYDVAIAAEATDKEVRFMESSGVKSFQRFGTAADRARQNVDRNIVSLNAVALAASRAADALDNAGIKNVKRGNVPVPVKVPGSNDDTNTNASNAAKGASKAAKAAAAMAKTVADATKRATAALTKMNDKLTAAREKLAQAKEAFASFRDGVKDSINGLLNFGDAANAETGTFLQNLRAQANGIVSFAAKVQQLIRMGLSESAIQQVLAAGAEAGTRIADELIAGGASAIAETNALVSSVNTAATALGQAGATAFYQAGITQGQAMVNGIIAAIKKSGFRIVGGFAALPKHLQKALDAGKLNAAQIKELNTILSGVPALANGGIVNQPTLALIGEAGPEAVVPLSGRNSGMGKTINLTVNAGMGADGTQIGREIVEAIKKYERSSGPIFASA